MAPNRSSTSGYHIYEFDGVRYPSVTTILSRVPDPTEKDSIASWRRNFSMPGFLNADDYVNYTAIRGTLVHYNVLNSVVRRLTPVSLDMSDLPEYSQYSARADRILKEVAHCRKLWDDLNLDIKLPLSVEVAGYHPDKMYAGTKDLHAKIEGVKTILDLKTSSRIYDKHLIQGAAYHQMANYWCKGSSEQVMIVALNPSKAKAMVKIVDWIELSQYVDEFNERLTTFWQLADVRRQYSL